MSKNKTRPSGSSGDVERFLQSVVDEQRRRDCQNLVKLMRKVTRCPPVLWGGSIVGFGTYHYKYASGHEGDAPLVGFSPRKQALTLYLGCDVQRSQDLLARLGKHKTGKGCLYVKSLEDVDHSVLEQLIREAVARTKAMYPG